MIREHVILKEEENEDEEDPLAANSNRKISKEINEKIALMNRNK